MTINKTGLITMANTEAYKIFNHLNKKLPGRQIEEILGNQTVIQAALEVGKPSFDVEIEIETGNQKLYSFRIIKPSSSKVFIALIMSYVSFPPAFSAVIH